MHRGALSFERRDDGRLLAGVARGFADRHGLDPIVVRGALVVLSFTGGVGVVLYVIGAALSQPPGRPPAVTARREPMRNLSVAAVTAGVVVLVRSSGLWLGDLLMGAVVVTVAGVVVLGVLRPQGRPWEALAEAGVAPTGRFATMRIVGGAVLVAFGLALVGLSGQVSANVRVGVIATAATLLGLGLVVGPWLARLLQHAAEDRRQRIRADEREALAAHLHDSVLQTLALIQRTAEDPRRTVTLARRQEAELREWLYGTPGGALDSVAAAVRAAAAEVETTYDVTIDTVVVGDRPLDERTAALVAALREACVNAAKHAGTRAASVFVECTPGHVEAFVRDRGRGFDPSATPHDRRGIADSIVGRLERVGGTATLESVPGEGTDVHLRLPYEPARVVAP